MDISVDIKASKNRKKVFIVLFVVVAVVLLGIGFFFIYSHFLNTSNNSSGHQEDKENETYFISDSISESLKETVYDIAENKKWKQTNTEKDADLKIEASPGIAYDDSEQNTKSFYQIIVPTKNWKLLTQKPSEITYKSGKIDTPNLEEIIGERFTLNVKNDSDEKGIHLDTLHELDATRIVVPVDNKVVFDKEWWKKPDYPLAYTIEISGDKDLINKFTSDTLFQEFLENFDYLEKLPSPEDFVTVAKTGTSVAGGPGWELCERTHSMEYPIKDVKDFLSESDIAILSNESSFVEGCSQSAGTTAFCGKPEYLQNLKTMGIDIVSLTGNHMADYGRNVYADTMSTYTNNDIAYFGAGANSQEAWTPLIYNTQAGKIAFIGFNKMGPDGVIATDQLAGSAYYDEAKLEAAIEQASSSADIVWVDTHLWPEYGTTPGNDQVEHSQESIDLGADIVTGVSSHEIQGATFYHGKPVFYGLGNFLFDQMWSTETRQGLVLSIHIYDKGIRNIEIKPTILYDYCQPRFAEGSTNANLLNYVLEISSF
ncbi:CapA family protein [Candidatus Dojkabacteria bacterium]|nr:CapA family protein [Candidatus Dojkabacteria bacterium]